MTVIAEGPTRKNVFKEVARIRADDAAVLLRQNRVLGAIYLLGYSIECYLKFAACEQNEWTHLPELVRLPGARKETALYTHHWPDLVIVCGVLKSLREKPALSAIYSTLSENWGPHLRYRTAPFRKSEGAQLYNHLLEFYRFLEELVP